jgi:hypothetical protein
MMAGAIGEATMTDGKTLMQSVAADLERRISIREKLTPEYFEQEREKIFRRSWLLIGNVVDLPQKGSYLVREVPSLRASFVG